MSTLDDMSNLLMTTPKDIAGKPYVRGEFYAPKIIEMRGSEPLIVDENVLVPGLSAKDVAGLEFDANFYAGGPNGYPGYQPETLRLAQEAVNNFDPKAAKSVDLQKSASMAQSLGVRFESGTLDADGLAEAKTRLLQAMETATEKATGQPFLLHAYDFDVHKSAGLHGPICNNSLASALINSTHAHRFSFELDNGRIQLKPTSEALYKGETAARLTFTYDELAEALTKKLDLTVGARNFDRMLDAIQKSNPKNAWSSESLEMHAENNIYRGSSQPRYLVGERSPTAHVNEKAKGEIYASIARGRSYQSMEELREMIVAEQSTNAMRMRVTEEDVRKTVLFADNYPRSSSSIKNLDVVMQINTAQVSAVKESDLSTPNSSSNHIAWHQRRSSFPIDYETETQAAQRTSQATRLTGNQYPKPEFKPLKGDYDSRVRDFLELGEKVKPTRIQDMNLSPYKMPISQHDINTATRHSDSPSRSIIIEQETKKLAQEEAHSRKGLLGIIGVGSKSLGINMLPAGADAAIEAYEAKALSELAKQHYAEGKVNKEQNEIIQSYLEKTIAAYTAAAPEASGVAQDIALKQSADQMLQALIKTGMSAKSAELYALPSLSGTLENLSAVGVDVAVNRHAVNTEMRQNGSLRVVCRLMYVFIKAS